MNVGMFSAESKRRGHPTYFYRRPDGSEVEVSSVVRKGEEDAFKWDDKQNLGEVTEFARAGKPCVRLKSMRRSE